MYIRRSQGGSGSVGFCSAPSRSTNQNIYTYQSQENCPTNGVHRIERLKGVPYLYKTDKGWSADIPFLKHDLFNQWTLR